MSLDTGATDRVDSHRLAAAARSILACPADLTLRLDGVSDPASLDGQVELQDHAGHPILSCAPDSPLALAAHRNAAAVLTVHSGLGRPGTADRDATLTLSGHLEITGLEECSCCTAVRLRVTLHLDLAVLSRPGAAAGPVSGIGVPLAAFTSPAHDLNRGLLQRSAEHTDLCHQAELRRAVSARTATPLRDVIGVHVADLRPDGLLLRWVDRTGAHESVVPFGRRAADAADLGDLLRDALHAGIC
ncbi:hypothetical protein JK386_10380 [Nocardioides sp. zg-536]|uniref:DUF2470 domain-containing protein n=1 Tax=Nocardioides faecalis TaxID=2803858 RepID=A0A938YAJ9_9ACTN|nr:hypothetical protein [Nocardioides faecalis]MBM9460309.1 hypothetical protein [Nocardioides faecalis]MBS4751234.1 hypothetical protein [Nocardioides faecalis]QVI59857.1 hypothetical protein KG111_05880 [Nocardioides faecalis]